MRGVASWPGVSEQEWAGRINPVRRGPGSGRAGRAGDRPGGLRRERHRPDAAPLADDANRIRREVDVLHIKAGALPNANAAVEQDAEDGLVVATGERLAVAHLEQPGDLLIAEHGHRLGRRLGLLQARHRVAVELAAGSAVC